MDMGTHAVQLLRTLLGPVTEVVATIGNASGVYSAVDDNGVALLRFASGVLATVEASWLQTGGLAGLEVVGSEATLYHAPGRGYVTQKPREKPEDVAEGTARPTRVDRLCAAVRGELGPEELEADLACAIDAVAIMEACYASSESGCWTKVAEV